MRARKDVCKQQREIQLTKGKWWKGRGTYCFLARLYDIAVMNERLRLETGSRARASLEIMVHASWTV